MIFRAALVAIAALAPRAVARADGISSRYDSDGPRDRDSSLRHLRARPKPPTFPTRAANGLHITTRPRVVRRELLFRAGEPYDSARRGRNGPKPPVARHLPLRCRSTRCGPTRGWWSGSPPGTAGAPARSSTSRAPAGGFSPTVGLEELNFLGTATLASIRYKSDPDRSTITTVFRQPRLFAGRVGLTFLYAHLSDGDIGQAQIAKPFFSLSGTQQLAGRGRRARSPGAAVLRRRSRPRGNAAAPVSLGYAAAAWALHAGPAGYLRLGVSGQMRREDFADDARVDTIGKTITGAVGPFLQWRRARFLVSRGLQGFAREEDIDVSTTVGVGLTVAPRAFGYTRTTASLRSCRCRPDSGGPASFVQLSAIAEGRYTAAGLDSGAVHLAGDGVLPARPAPSGRHSRLDRAGWTGRRRAPNSIWAEPRRSARLPAALLHRRPRLLHQRRVPLHRHQRLPQAHRDRSWRAGSTTVEPGTPGPPSATGAQHRGRDSLRLDPGHRCPILPDGRGLPQPGGRRPASAVVLVIGQGFAFSTHAGDWIAEPRSRTFSPMTEPTASPESAAAPLRRRSASRPLVDALASHRRRDRHSRRCSCSHSTP